jgi:mono/diheme cytochrome c family protein
MKRIGQLCVTATVLLAVTSIARAEGDYASRAKDDYQLNCMGCHAENGEGLKGKVPSLRAELGRLLATPQGREFVQRVPGVSQSALPSDRLAAVLNWIVSEYTAAPVASKTAPFTAAEVERLRHQPLLNVAAARAGL